MCAVFGSTRVPAANLQRNDQSIFFTFITNTELFVINEIMKFSERRAYNKKKKKTRKVNFDEQKIIE